MVAQLKDEGTRAQVVLSGAVAGLLSRFVIAPLDVIKIRLQLQIHSLSDPLSHHAVQGGPTYKGIVPTLRQILLQEGITGLWKGNIPAEGLYLCYGATQFLTYRTTNQYLTSSNFPLNLPSSANSFISGATAGVISTTATYPLDLLRTRFAAAGPEKVYPSLLTGIREISKNEGTKGFFRGLSAANLQIVPYMGLFFTAYELFRPILSASHLPLDWMGSADGLSGILASVLAKTSVYPLDTVRKRLQVQGPSRSKYVHRNIPEYNTGPLGTIRAIVVKEGIRGLYRGLTVSLLKAAPTSAVTLWTYERVMSTLRYLENVE